MSQPPAVLDGEQIEHFLEYGYLRLSDCFDVRIGQQWIDRTFVKLGYDPADPSTWAQPRVHMPGEQHVEVRAFAPKVWAAMCELVGGEDRIRQPVRWADSFIINFGLGADEPWQPPSAATTGWHKDGDFFLHFLDSPEQGLLVLVIWKDIAPKGGGTFVCSDSVPVVARYMAAHPEGVDPYEFPIGELLSQCSRFEEITGKAGDVILLHPYMLHAASQNVLREPRFITNPPISLREPMQFDRSPGEVTSVVERGVLRGLGVERYAFKPTAPRQPIVPKRLREQQRLADEAAARLQAKGVM